MKNIVKQFKESISKLIPEEFKKIWDKIKADYPVFNPITNCFECEINNTETLEKAIETIKKHLIDLCEAPNYEEDNYNAGYITAIDEKTSEIFKAGVNFAQKWVDIEEELPEYYQRILADNGEYMAIVSRVSDGDEDSYPICGTDFNMYPNPIKWRLINMN